MVEGHYGGRGTSYSTLHQISKSERTKVLMKEIKDLAAEETPAHKDEDDEQVTDRISYNFSTHDYLSRQGTVSNSPVHCLKSRNTDLSSATAGNHSARQGIQSILPPSALLLDPLHQLLPILCRQVLCHGQIHSTNSFNPASQLDRDQRIPPIILQRSRRTHFVGLHHGHGADLRHERWHEIFGVTLLDED